mmetsp:Transcript_52725/g.146380  ORF Transcript_52725/g.146380 Transcript_52725/m.146380 type:complete len:305 (-) Transcript_52725:631-1545(-)
MAVSQGEEEVRLTEEEEANTDHHHLHVAKALVNCVTEINDFGVDAVVDHLDTEFGKGVFECIEHLDHGFLARTKLIEEEHKSRDDREDENEGEGEHERQVHKAHESPEQALETTVGNAIQAALGPCTVLGGRVLVDVRLRLRRLGLANLREGDLHLGCELVGRRVQEVVGLGRHAKVGAVKHNFDGTDNLVSLGTGHLKYQPRDHLVAALKARDREGLLVLTLFEVRRHGKREAVAHEVHLAVDAVLGFLAVDDRVRLVDVGEDLRRQRLGFVLLLMVQLELIERRVVGARARAVRADNLANLA